MTRILLIIAFFIVFWVITFTTEDKCTLIEEKDPMAHTDAYNDIIQKFRNHEQTFVDDSFPHATSSVGIEAKNIDIQWLRPDKIATHDSDNNNNTAPWSLFNDPQPTDVEQGYLGNCWFISALAGVAERPDILLEKLFVTKEYNPSGVYEMRLCIDGIWQHILVDDYFPSHAQGHRMLFATGSKKQLWVPLVEKALAKAYGSYSALSGRMAIKGLATLTGWPILSINLEKHRALNSEDPELELLWARLISARKARYLMICDCGEQKSSSVEQEYSRVGLVTLHGYSILDVRQISKGQRLLQLRNPWGSSGWLGEFSPDWSEWTPRLRRELANEASDLPGTFWMPFHRFVEYFELVGIAEVRDHEGWVATRYKVNLSWQEGQTFAIRLIITDERTELCAILFQHNARQRQHLDIMLLLHKQKGTTNEPGDLIARSPHTTLPFVRTDNIFLDPGVYLLYVHSFAKFGAQQMVAGTIVIHSSKSIFTELMPVSLDNLQASLVVLILKEGKVRYKSHGVTARSMAPPTFTQMMLMVDNNNPDFYYQIVAILTHFGDSKTYHPDYDVKHRYVKFPQLRDLAPRAKYYLSHNYPTIQQNSPHEVLHRPNPI